MIRRAALPVLLAAAICSAQSPERLFEQAVEQFSAQRFAEAERLLAGAVQQRPKWFEPRFLLGATLVSLGRAEDAIVHLDAAHRLNPAHLDCVKLLAAEYLGLDRPADAIRVVRPRLQRPDEELLLLAIEALHVRNDAGDAEEAFRLGALGLKRFPRSPRLLTWHGFALRETGSLAEARKWLESALTLAPGDPAATSILGDVLRREGRLEEAVPYFDRVLAQVPADEDALVGKARTLAAMGRTAEALDLVRAAIRSAPAVARLRLEASQLHAKLGDREGAAAEAAEFRRLQGSRREPAVPSGLRTASERAR